MDFSAVSAGAWKSVLLIGVKAATTVSVSLLMLFKAGYEKQKNSTTAAATDIPKSSQWRLMRMIKSRRFVFVGANSLFAIPIDEAACILRSISRSWSMCCNGNISYEYKP